VVAGFDDRSRDLLEVSEPFSMALGVDVPLFKKTVSVSSVDSV
jgi:hypothetical protein